MNSRYDYILGYINGYQDGQQGARFRIRSEHDRGYEDGEDPEYPRRDLEHINGTIEERLSFFAV